MDEARYGELVQKRDSTGLSDEEADELGRLIAEKEGVPYQGHGSDVRDEDIEGTPTSHHLPGSPSEPDVEREEIVDDERTRELEER